jgi:hypothetical protein
MTQSCRLFATIGRQHLSDLPWRRPLGRHYLTGESGRVAAWPMPRAGLCVPADAATTLELPDEKSELCRFVLMNSVGQTVRPTDVRRFTGR